MGRGRAAHFRTALLLLTIWVLKREATDGLWRGVIGEDLLRSGGEAAPRGVEAGKETDRQFLKAGSVYQNDYMTLWSSAGVPISVTLRIHAGDRFEMLVEHLDSTGGGSEGWFAVGGSFGTETLPGAPGRLRLVPEPEQGQPALKYDENVLGRATAMAYKCLQRVPTGVLRATELEIDTNEDAVLVTPRAAVVRMLWAEPVILRPTSEDRLWEPRSTEPVHGHADQLPAAGA